MPDTDPDPVAILRQAQSVERSARASLIRAEHAVAEQRTARARMQLRRLGLVLALVVALAVAGMWTLILLGIAGVVWVGNPDLRREVRRHQRRRDRRRLSGSAATRRQVLAIREDARTAYDTVFELLRECERGMPEAQVWPGAGYSETAVA